MNYNKGNQDTIPEEDNSDNNNGEYVPIIENS